MKNKSVQGHRGWPPLGADDLLSKPVQLPSGVGTYQHRLLLDRFLLFRDERDLPSERAPTVVLRPAGELARFLLDGTGGN